MAALTASCIPLNIQGNSDYSILRQLATIACQNGFITDSHTFLQILLRREKMHSTGFGSGIAVPQKAPALNYPSCYSPAKHRPLTGKPATAKAKT